MNLSPHYLLRGMLGTRSRHGCIHHRWLSCCETCRSGNLGIGGNRDYCFEYLDQMGVKLLEHCLPFTEHYASKLLAFYPAKGTRTRASTGLC